MNSVIKFEEDPFYVEIRPKEDHKIAKKATKYDLSLHIKATPKQKRRPFRRLFHTSITSNVSSIFFP